MGDTPERGSRRIQESSIGFLRRSSCHGVLLWPCERDEHGYSCDFCVARILEVTGLIPSDELLTAHPEILPRLTVKDLSTFYRRDLVEIRVGVCPERLKFGCV